MPINHKAVCTCAPGYEDDGIGNCQQIQRAPPVVIPSTPCTPFPCGPNAECRERNGAGACYCREGYEGNPFDQTRGCRHECENNDECIDTMTCVRFKCVNPCVGICGTYAICEVKNHIPKCVCPSGYTGDPYSQCREIVLTTVEPYNLCEPTPCGPYSNCRENNAQAVCSCQVGYIGTPPTCRPECVVNSECSTDRACINQKCTNPCPNTCGFDAHCHTRNHNPICACPPGYTGDPFSQCRRISMKKFLFSC